MDIIFVLVWCMGVFVTIEIYLSEKDYDSKIYIILIDLLHTLVRLFFLYEAANTVTLKS